MSPTNSGDLVLQMDIEGAEYRNILGTSDSTLKRFRYIVLELHGLRRAFEDPAILSQVLLPFLEKLHKNLVCVHVHPNNYSDEGWISGVETNIGDVMKVTFCRRDWYEANLHNRAARVVLPHPLDIKRNNLQRMPIVLGDEWLGRKRSVEDQIGLMRDEIDFIRCKQEHDIEQRLGKLNEALYDSITFTMRAQAQQGASALSESEAIALEEIANGKSYLISSTAGLSTTGVISEDYAPYFFHTNLDFNQWITVDLEECRTIRRIVIANRRDACWSRAKFLFLVTHLEMDYRSGKVNYINAPPSFFSAAPEDAVIDIPPTAARFITIVSPLYTYLHLSKIQVYATTSPDSNASEGPKESLSK